jgi:ABC-type tungstate transport system substrate-binding protein
VRKRLLEVMIVLYFILKLQVYIEHPLTTVQSVKPPMMSLSTTVLLLSGLQANLIVRRDFNMARRNVVSPAYCKMVRS